MDYQFFIRSTVHTPSLMSADADFFGRLVTYKRELGSIFDLVKTKLVFVEYYLPPPSPKKEKDHFDILVFPVQQDSFDGLREYFCRAIGNLKGSEDVEQNTITFKNLDHLRSIQKEVSLVVLTILFKYIKYISFLILSFSNLKSPVPQTESLLFHNFPRGRVLLRD